MKKDFALKISSFLWDNLSLILLEVFIITKSGETLFCFSCHKIKNNLNQLMILWFCISSLILFFVPPLTNLSNFSASFPFKSRVESLQALSSRILCETMTKSSFLLSFRNSYSDHIYIIHHPRRS